MSSSLIRQVLVAIGTLALATPAAAMDWAFTSGSVLTFYGQINLGWLNYNDGAQGYDSFPVGNSNSSTRAGLLFESGDGTWDARFEFQYQPRPSSAISQLDHDPVHWSLEKTDIRKLEYDWRPAFGSFALGQGSMASDGIAEIDLSGTTVAAYSSITDLAAGNFYRRNDGGLSGVTVGDTAGNLDGSRRMRVRYDTPDWNGFSLAAAYGREVLQDNNDNDYTDIALRYGGGTDIWDYAAGAGYNWTSGSGSTSEFWSGSGSVLHKPTGLSGTLAAGGNSGGTSYWYGKLGLGRDVWSIGATALSVDYYAGSGFETTGSNTTSWSVAGVQEFDSINLEYYLVYRNYAYQDSTAGYQDGQVFMTGLRWIW